MKSSFSRQPRGFTLVELLVVISIIVVLASAGFTAANAAIQKARKTTALATATAIESAVNNFYNDYGTMPKAGGEDTTIQTDTDIGFLDTLLGNDDNDNPRGIRFLSVKEGKRNKTNGLIYTDGGNTIIGLYDPWGGPYNVMLDLNLDEKLDVKPKGGAATRLNGRRVAAWSDGADGVNGTGKPSDDVKTWGN